MADDASSVVGGYLEWQSELGGDTSPSDGENVIELHERNLISSFLL